MDTERKLSPRASAAILLIGSAAGWAIIIGLIVLVWQVYNA